MPKLAQVELTSQETATLLALTRARLLELERVIHGMEEAEGMDLQRHNALKAARPQQKLLEDLVMKLEGAMQDAARSS